LIVCPLFVRATLLEPDLEPDPAIEWNKARINSLRQALTSLALPND
jgi:hypothetical protein